MSKFIAGFNMAGYMPDNNPDEFDTFEEAKNSTIAMTKHFEGQSDTEEEAEELCALAEAINLENDEFSYIFKGYCYWVTKE